MRGDIYLLPNAISSGSIFAAYVVLITISHGRNHAESKQERAKGLTSLCCKAG